MKKLSLALVAIAFAIKVGAVTVTVDQVAGYNAGDGEFNVSPITGVGYSPLDLYNNNSGQLGFGTFCVDRALGITVPGTYNATIIPSGVAPSGNQISVGTAWLFQQFALGSLAGYNYTPGAGRVDSAYLLQGAIWLLEGQISNFQNDIFYNAAIAHFGSVAAAAADNNQQFSVGVLNLTYASTVTDAAGNVHLAGSIAQPMLTLLPDGGSALILLGMGLTGLAVFAKKFRK